MRPGLHLHLWHGIIHYQAFCRLPWRVMQHSNPAGAKEKRNRDWVLGHIGVAKPFGFSLKVARTQQINLPSAPT